MTEPRPRAVIQDWAESGGMALTALPGEPPSPAMPGAATALRQALAVTATLAVRLTGTAPSLPDIRLLGERAASSGLVRSAGQSVGGAARTLQTRDGWLVLSLPRPQDVATVPALIESESVDEPWPAVAEWARRRRAREAVERAQLLGLAAAAVPSAPPAPVRAVATTPGGPRTRWPRPLVVDLSALWAGPLCASMLAMAGAEVVKVEGVGRLDGARLGASAFYDLLHHGHRSVTVDLASAGGRADLLELVHEADVVIESSRPRALAQLGVAAMDAVGRGTIWTSITAYGRAGPWANRVGFGDDVAAAAGLVAELDGVPVPCGDAVADPLAGAHAAAATMAALLSDTGRLIDVSMFGVACKAARIRGERCRVSGSAATGWVVEWDGGGCDVAPPTTRQPAGPAAAPGADNYTVPARRVAS